MAHWAEGCTELPRELRPPGQSLSVCCGCQGLKWEFLQKSAFSQDWRKVRDLATWPTSNRLELGGGSPLLFASARPEGSRHWLSSLPGLLLLPEACGTWPAILPVPLPPDTTLPEAGWLWCGQWPSVPLVTG